jgi:hypothetical protein
MGENVKTALSVFAPSRAEAGAPEKKNPRVLLFTGHRIDDTGRKTPRFPGDKESVARQAIKDAVAKEIAEAAEIAFGIAGGASGGDIFFHEVCAELGIPHQALPGLAAGSIHQGFGPVGRPAMDRTLLAAARTAPRAGTGRVGGTAALAAGEAELQHLAAR